VIHQFIAQFFPFTQTVDCGIARRHKLLPGDFSIIQDLGKKAIGAQIIHPRVLEHCPVLAEPLNKELARGILTICAYQEFKILG
jgi:hypothetical protein